MALIECDNLDIGYEGRNVIKNLSFQIEEGQYICIVGENGAGKTTLMKSILGLHKCSGGKIKFSEGLHRDEIGYIPQQSSAQKSFPATVWEVVLSGCMNSHKGLVFYNKQDRERALQNMERLGIRELKNKSYGDLSGGQQQRVLMARALCATKKILFLDEPMAGLDPETSQGLYSMLEEINRLGITIVMVSHDLRGVMQHAEYILDLTKGKEFFGKVEEYRSVGHDGESSMADEKKLLREGGQNHD